MLAFTFNSSGALSKNHHLVNTSRNKRFPSKLWPILPWLFKNYTAIHPQYFSFKNATSATFLIIHWWEHWVCKLVWKCLIPNCTVMHILKMLLLKVMQPPTEWASSTGYFSQSDTSLWHTLSLNWPTATERAADPCVEADLSSTQPTQERQKLRTRLLKERERNTDWCRRICCWISSPVSYSISLPGKDEPQPWWKRAWDHRATALPQVSSDSCFIWSYSAVFF